MTVSQLLYNLLLQAIPVAFLRWLWARVNALFPYC